MSDTQWERMLDFGVVSTIMFTYLLRPREKKSPFSGSEFKLREGRVRRRPSKVHHAIAQNRHHPARVELMWRLAPYYELFIPTTCQLKPSIESHQHPFNVLIILVRKPVDDEPELDSYHFSFLRRRQHRTHRD
jgi:hypothetical protein